ncbi:MAG: M67 family metallopeptidase [Gemmatimonadetes bacterium]|nr:M67 family metallopeptidase [Gemmatimonadota bacterium]MYB70602.1 M67 family metallopeptidase [Gemmatimonadota bacterium]
MLCIARRDFDRICVQALAEYPHECCGLLVEEVPSGVSAVHTCTNVQQQRHEEDPEHYPRDASMAYLIDAGEQLRIAEETEKAGGRVSGCYHSHIDCAAYFSDEDERRTWIFNSREAGDDPDDPDVMYLVLSVYGEETGSQRKVQGYKCFAWDGSHYAETGVEIV